MSGIKVALSPPEALQRFRDLVESISEICGEVTQPVRIFLEEKARAFSVHHVDVEEIMRGLAGLCENSLKLVTKCPVCELASDFAPDDLCSHCGWDFRFCRMGNSAIEQAREKKKLEIARLNWGTLQQLNSRTASQFKNGDFDNAACFQCRHSGRQSTQQLTFRDNGDGTITDLRSKRMWRRNPEGGTRNWRETLDNAKSFSLAGYRDWRVPTIDELKSIINEQRRPALDPAFINTSTSGKCWSADAFSPYTAWYMDIETGITYWGYLELEFDAMYVRNSS